MAMTRANTGLLLISAAFFGCGGEDEREVVSETKCEETRSGFPGDCLALQAPDPKQGFQLHFGPKNYDDFGDVERFLIQPGDEKVTCLYSTTPNAKDVYFSEYHATVRPGTHHMIVWAGHNGNPNMVVPEDGTLTDRCRDNLPFLVGIQNGINPDGARIDVPGDREIAKENAGLASIIPARSRVAFQTHYVNTGTEPILRESWANFIYLPKSEVEQVATPLFWIGGLEMNVPAHSRQVIQAQCVNGTDEPRRLVGLTGHMHAHATRFSAYKVTAGSAERELVYEEYDWSDSHMFYYDSVNRNPAPDPVNLRAGATSGVLVLAPGDRIEWECEVDNTSAEPLEFGDKAYAAEMCNLFGMFTPGHVGAWNCFNR